MWLNREKRRDWTTAKGVVRLNSLFRTWWYHIIPNSFRKHQWLRSSILSTSLLETAHELYRKIDRMEVLYTSSTWCWNCRTGHCRTEWQRWTVAGLDNATPKPVLVLGTHSVDNNRPDEQHATHELRIRRAKKKPTWLKRKDQSFRQQRLWRRRRRRRPD